MALIAPRARTSPPHPVAATTACAAHAILAILYEFVGMLTTNERLGPASQVGSGSTGRTCQTSHRISRHVSKSWSASNRRMCRACRGAMNVLRRLAPSRSIAGCASDHRVRGHRVADGLRPERAFSGLALQAPVAGDLRAGGHAIGNVADVDDGRVALHVAKLARRRTLPRCFLKGQWIISPRWALAVDMATASKNLCCQEIRIGPHTDDDDDDMDNLHSLLPCSWTESGNTAPQPPSP